ncbi:MAG TPA: hypothetical protein VFF03_12370 [Rhodocyclaceae bacterium]|nr:hypothetical protein [Rhodocyclaceae bacterium]
MTSPNQALNGILQANMETAQQYAQLAFDSAERIFRTQAESLRDMCDLNSNEYIYFWSGNSGKPLEHLPELVSKRLDFAAGLTRQYQDTATQIQSAFFRIAEKQLPALQKNLQTVLDDALPPL